MIGCPPRAIAEIGDAENIYDALHQCAEDVQLLDCKADELFGMER